MTAKEVEIDHVKFGLIKDEITANLPSSWAISTLGESFKWGSGGTPRSGAQEYYAGGTIPWLIIGDLNDGVVNASQTTITELGLKDSSAKLVEAGTILIAMYGSIGKLGIAGKALTTNQAIAFAYKNEIDPMYLFYFLMRIRGRLISLGKGATQLNISQTVIKAFPFVIAPLNEQHRIVAKIEELFSELNNGIESLKTAQEQLKVYRQSLLKYAFEGKLTDEWRKKNIATLESADVMQSRIQLDRKKIYQQQIISWEAGGKKGGKPRAPKPLDPLTAEELAELPELPKGWFWFSIGAACLESTLGKMLDREKNKGELKPYLRNINVRWGQFNLDNLLEMKFEKDELSRYGLKEGDLVICEGGEPGRSAVWRSLFGGEMLIQKALHRIRFTKSVNPFFVQKYFELCASNRRLEKMFTGTTIKHLTGEKLARMAIPICSIDEQIEVLQILEAKLSEVDQLQLATATSLQQSQALRQSILQKAFSGQLVPQDPNDEPASELLARIKTELAKSKHTKKKKAA